MRGYLPRVLLLMLLAAVSAAAVVFTSAAALPQPAEELPIEVPQAESTETPAAPQLLLRSETARECLSLYSDSWELQASLRLSEAGEGTVDRPPAGAYRLIRADGSIVRFETDAQGSVTVTDGMGYGSGDMLMLTQERRGSVELRYHATDVDGIACRIEGSGGVFSGALAQQDAETAVLTFPGLKEGTYRVYVGGEWVITVELAEYAMERKIELY